MILNGKVFNPGELRTEVSIQRRGVTADAGGFQSQAWTTLATIKAKWAYAHGAEIDAATGLQVDKMATVTIRYTTGIDETCVVLKGSDRYEITGIDDIRERHEYMEIKCRKMRAG